MLLNCTGVLRTRELRSGREMAIRERETYGASSYPPQPWSTAPALAEAEAEAEAVAEVEEELLWRGLF